MCNNENNVFDQENSANDETPDKWLEPEEYQKLQRLNYIISLKSHIPRSRCPHCKTHTMKNDGWEEYCTICGLVTMTAYPVSAGEIYHPIYGIK